MAAVEQFLRTLLDLLLPPICHICHSFIPNGGKLHICPQCREQIPAVSSPLCPICGIPFIGMGSDHRCGHCVVHPPHFDLAHSHFRYEGAIRELIHSFKYNRRTHLRAPLALLTLEWLPTFLAHQRPDLIVPVPLHPSRLRQRGFNQAVLIGTVLSRHLSLPLIPDVLVRTRVTEPQITLPAAERHTNVHEAFAVKKPEAVTGKRILLLDDVMTTGSTLNECARVLKKTGAIHIMAITVARTARDG